MHRRLFILTGLACMVSCEWDAPVVRMPLGGSAAGTAGQSTNASAGNADGGTSGTGGSSDPYSQDKYDWCLPPAYDPMLAPSGSGCDDISTSNVATRWTVTILLDRSLSMRNLLPGSTMSKWVAVGNALSKMANEPRGFLDQWSLMAFAQADTGVDSCDASSYQATPPTWQVLPNLDVSSIQKAFDDMSATAATRPTAAALQAAIVNVQTNAATLRGVSSPIVIVITDGIPYGCASGGEMEHLIEAAKTANPATAANFARIHVIQLGMDYDYDLRGLAEAGDTKEPYVISGGDVDRQLVKILRRILYPGPANCEPWITFSTNDTTGGTVLDFDVKMDSAFTNSYLALPRLSSAEACANSPAGGFWITESGADQHYVVGLCPCTCAAMGTARRTTVTYCSD